MEKAYIDTARLLLEAAPAIFHTTGFAMKGGTAINLFVQDMPRLSVDIDVVCTDHRMARTEALSFISESLNEARRLLSGAGLAAEVASTNTGDEIKLLSGVGPIRSRSR